MDQIGLTHISSSVSDLSGALEKVEQFGREMGPRRWRWYGIRIGQLLELLSDGWLAFLSPRPRLWGPGGRKTFNLTVFSY